VLRGLNVASTGVAVAMPWVAEAKAAAVAREYGTTVHGGLMLSASLAPGVDVKGAGAPGSAFEHVALSSASGGAGGTRLGLPVQEDEFTVLCGRAGHTVMDVVLSPFDAFGVPTEWAKGFVQNLVETFPGYFCGGSGGTAGSVGSTVGGGGAAGGIADLTAAEICKRTKAEIDLYNQAHTKKKTFDEDKCLEDATKGTKKGLGKKIDMGAPMKGDTSGKTPKRVYDGAKNGDDYFAIWSFAWGDLKSQSSAQRGVDIAAWNQQKTRDPSILSKSAFAKAEFYYDIAPRRGKRAAWDDYKDDAMWNLRWRARMRRVKSPGSALGNLVGAKLGEHLGEYMGGFLGDSSAAHAALDWMTAWPSNVADGVDDATRSAIGTSARDNGYFTVIH
jgi:hypothetical protein